MTQDIWKTNEYGWQQTTEGVVFHMEWLNNSMLSSSKEACGASMSLLELEFQTGGTTNEYDPCIDQKVCMSPLELVRYQWIWPVNRSRSNIKVPKWNESFGATSAQKRLTNRKGQK